MKHSLLKLIHSVAVAAVVIGAPVQPVFAEPVTLHWAGCGITRKAFMSELAAAYERRTGVHIEVGGGGATKGIRDTAKGVTELGGSCRWTLENPATFRPIAAERQVKMVPVAWDALVVIAHPDNPVDNISFGQVRGVYSGEIADWGELGGRQEPIDLFVRKGRISGVGHTIRKLVFADFDYEFPASAQRFPSSGPLEKAVAANPNGLAITGVGSAKRRPVKILTIDGVEPTLDNIQSGDYMFYRPLFLVIKKRGAKPAAQKFIDFTLSEAGRRIIREAGTLPYRDGLNLVARQIKEQQAATRRGLYQRKDK